MDLQCLKGKSFFYLEIVLRGRYCNFRPLYRISILKNMGKIKTASNKHLIWLLDNQRGDTIEYLRKIQRELSDKYPTAHAFEQQMIKTIQFQIKCFLYFNDRSENTSAQADILISNFMKRYGQN